MEREGEKKEWPGIIEVVPVPDLRAEKASAYRALRVAS
jgi:hypothetical protein